MIPFQIHRRIPLLRRPFFQRDQAMRERDAVMAERSELIAERDALVADRDRLAAQIAGMQKRKSATNGAEMPSVKTVPLERRMALCGLIDVQHGKGLELGPLSTPIVSVEQGDIRYVDHASTADLQRKYAVNDGHDVSRLVDISYVWSGGRLRDAIGDGRVFDYAIASHVIEHVPDVIGWLDNIFSVLRDGGILSLAIPDRRYTFDLVRPTTTPAMLIDNWLRPPRGHTPQQVFDHFSQVVKVAHDEIIALFDGADVVAERHHTDEFALAMAKDAASADRYTDCHASVFTPLSFLVTLRTLIGVGLIEAEVVDFYDTRFYSQEFVCVLKKSSTRDVSVITDLIGRLSAVSGG